MQGYTYFFPIAYSATDVAIYQQDVVIHRSEGVSYEETFGDFKVWHVYVGDRCKSDYGDVRFTDASGNALAYYLWPDYDAESARFTVRLEGADAAGVLRVWYGNPSAATTSDGGATYLLFEEFSNDLSQFNTGAKSGGKVEIDSGALKIYQDPSGAHWGGYASTKVKFTNGNGISIVFKHKKPAGYDAFLRQMQSIWAVTDSTTSGRNKYYYLPTTAAALIWKSPPYVSNFTESRIDISAEGTFRVNGGPWVSGITDPWGTAHPWSRVGATYNLEFLNCDCGNYPCYFDDIRVSAYSATPPAALTFSGERETASPPVTAFSIRPRASATIPTLSTDLKDDLINSLGGETVPEPGNDTINWTGLISTIGGAYTSVLGPLAYTLIFSIPFLMMWITQRDMTLPGLVGALLGLFIIVRLPAEFHLVAVTFIVISIVAVIYSLVKERV